MAEQEVQEEVTEMQAPAPGGSKKKMIIWILVAIVLLGIGVVVILLLTGGAKEDEADIQALLDDIPVVEEIVEEEEEEEELDAREFEGGPVTFDYINGWHLSGSQIADASDRVYPYLSAYADPEPWIVVGPLGGFRAHTMSFVLLDEGGEYIPPSEDAVFLDEETTWLEYSFEEIEVNGESAVQYMFEAPAGEYSYPRFQEVLVVNGVVATYTYEEIDETSLAAWELVKDTLVVTFTPSEPDVEETE